MGAAVRSDSVDRAIEARGRVALNNLRLARAYSTRPLTEPAQGSLRATALVEGAGLPGLLRG